MSKEVSIRPVSEHVALVEFSRPPHNYFDAALIEAAKGAQSFPPVAGTAAFYRAMSLFRQGKENEARKLATEAAAKMKPLPKDEKNPLAAGASADDLTLWLAYQEAKGLLRFDAAPAPSKGK